MAELPDISDAEEKEIDEAGSTVHHRAFVSTRPILRVSRCSRVLAGHLDRCGEPSLSPGVGRRVELKQMYELPMWPP